MARTSHFFPSPPGIRVPGLWHELSLLKRRSRIFRNQTNDITARINVNVRLNSACELSSTVPLFSLSIALLLPAYVGLISFPSSSMMASSSAYLF